MTQREPDRFEAKARELDRWIVRHYGVPEHYTSKHEIAAALRQAADEALERAAHIAESYGCDYAGREIRTLKSPAAAPAAETEPLGFCDWPGFKNHPHKKQDDHGCSDAHGNPRGCKNWRPAPPSEPVAFAGADQFAARLATQLVYARARIAALEAALREAQGQLCAEHCEWTGSDDHDDQCMKLSKVLAASPVAQGKGEGK